MFANHHRSYSNHAKLTFLWISLFIIHMCSCTIVDDSYCKRYDADRDWKDHVNDRGLPLLFMGETYEKKYYVTTDVLKANFFRGVFNTCERFGLTMATVKTACEYGIVNRWFLENYPTDYSLWVAGMRFGDFIGPTWITTGEPIDLSQFNTDIKLLPGPYPPGGYSPIVYPWVNCLSVSRNCLQFTSGPTNPCNQTATYPELQFMWEDCRREYFRVICEETSYFKEMKLDLDENDFEDR